MIIKSLPRLLKLGGYAIPYYKGKDWKALVRFTTDLNTIPLNRNFALKCWPMGTRQRISQGMLLDGYLLEYKVNTGIFCDIPHNRPYSCFDCQDNFVVAKKPTITLHYKNL